MCVSELGMSSGFTVIMYCELWGTRERPVCPQFGKFFLSFFYMEAFDDT